MTWVKPSNLRDLWKYLIIYFHLHSTDGSEIVNFGKYPHPTCQVSKDGLVFNIETSGCDVQEFYYIIYIYIHWALSYINMHVYIYMHIYHLLVDTTLIHERTPSYGDFASHLFGRIRKNHQLNTEKMSKV